MNNLPTNKKFEKSKVAVIYAVGAIDGGSNEGIISDKLVETINDVAKDDAVKSVVFRVSSPGGSAYGSCFAIHLLRDSLLNNEKFLFGFLFSLSK